MPPKIAKAPERVSGAFRSYRTDAVGSVLIVISAIIISRIFVITFIIIITIVPSILIGVALLRGIITAAKLVTALHFIAGSGVLLLVEEFVYLGPAFGVDLDEVERIRSA